MTHKTNNDTILALKSVNLRITRQRTEILNIILNVQNHLTAQDIFVMLVEQKKRYSFATIYRTVAAFEKAGLIKQVKIEDNPMAYYAFSGIEFATAGMNNNQIGSSGHRHYLVCTKCKKYIVIDSCPVDDFCKNIAAENDFLLTNHSFELFGICRECRNDKESTQ